VRVLVLNAGSSSLKASVVEDDETLLRTTVSWGGDATQALDRPAGVRAVLGALSSAGIDASSIGAVGHRVVHGGATFTRPVVVDDGVVAKLDALTELAPLHNAVAVEAVRVVRTALPTIPHIACFDTAFHASLPETVARYPVPEAWHTELGIRRFGFHGLSVAWAMEQMGQLLGRNAGEVEAVVAHLGSGCSVTAVSGGVSVATSMGFTPLEGLMMGTRAGSIDPGILLYLLRHRSMGLDELADALDHRSGLLGVSGRSADIRELEALADAGDERARLALTMFVDRAASGIAGVAVALNRLDALVFTGGIGEHAGRIRAAIVDRLLVLGIQSISPDENGQDRLLAPAHGPGAPDVQTPAILRIESREDLVVARAVSAVLGKG